MNVLSVLIIQKTNASEKLTKHYQMQFGQLTNMLDDILIQIICLFIAK